MTLDPPTHGLDPRTIFSFADICMKRKHFKPNCPIPAQLRQIYSFV